VLSLSLLLDAHVALRRDVALEIEMPAAYMSGDGGDDLLQAGNFAAAVAFSRPVSKRAAVTFGVGLGLPTAQIDDESFSNSFEGIDAAMALEFALSQRGAMGARRWQPEGLSVFAPLRFEVISPSGLFGASRSELALVSPMLDQYDVFGAFETQLAGGWRHPIGEVAVALNAVAFVGDRARDAQLSLEPRARVHFPARAPGRATGFVQARLVINLDDPRGFDREGGALIGTLITAGVAWR
jgi:hypothetical protein